MLKFKHLSREQKDAHECQHRNGPETLQRGCAAGSRDGRGGAGAHSPGESGRAHRAGQAAYLLVQDKTRFEPHDITPLAEEDVLQEFSLQANYAR
jgi:hypothetical protein